MVSSRCRTFGDKLFELRNKRGYSQETFAKTIGISRQIVSGWEANNKFPNANKYDAISKAIGVKIEFMLDNSRTLADITLDDFLDISDVVSCDLLRELGLDKELERLRIEREQKMADDNKQPAVDNEKPQKKKLSKKAKITIAVSVIAAVLLLGIAILIFDAAITPPYQEGQAGEPVRIHVWNFSAENIGWIIFSLALAAAAILGIVMLCKYVKTKKENKEEDADKKEKVTDKKPKKVKVKE